MTKGKPGPNVSGGPSTRAGRWCAGSAGKGSPKSTSHRSSTDAISDGRRFCICQIIRPGRRVPMECHEFARHLLSETLPAKGLSGVSHGLHQRRAAGRTQLEQRGVGLLVDSDRRRGHTYSLLDVDPKSMGTHRAAARPGQRNPFERPTHTRMWRSRHCRSWSPWQRTAAARCRKPLTRSATTCSRPHRSTSSARATERRMRR